MKSPISKWKLCNTLCAVIIAGLSAVQAQTIESSNNDEPALKHVQLHQLSESQHKFRLQFANPTSGAVILTITDAHGNTLLQKKLDQARFAQTFDLSTLQDGTYTFTLIRGKEVVKKTVQLNTDYITIKKAYIK